jgi:nitrite reductase/ring-hydroxylating ferredoxin subunit
MAFVRVGSVSDLPPGSLREVSVGDEPFALCNVNGELHALHGVCPHEGGPLGQGDLYETMIVCPWHAFEFDCRTGESDMDPELRVATVPVRIEGGDILINPEASA